MVVHACGDVTARYGEDPRMTSGTPPWESGRARSIGTSRALAATATAIVDVVQKVRADSVAQPTPPTGAHAVHAVLGEMAGMIATTAE